MAETKKKKRKRKKRVSITEKAVSLLLQRYSPETIIALLREVAHNADVKMDWNQLVKNTSTGITNAREYQMIWRHLAYQHQLFQDFDSHHQPIPLDDDSDLETQLKTFPPVSREISVEAAAYAKVLLGSDLPSDSGSLNCSTVEAPLTINIPSTRALPTDLDKPQLVCTQGKNIIVPVSVSRLSFPTTEVLEGNRSTTGPLKKRKPWTEEEDKELIAAVKKWGERNWVNIIKDNIKSDRTVSQLSQRWGVLRRYQHNLHSDATAETLLATRRAFSYALGMPVGDNLLAACTSGFAQSSSAAVPFKSLSGPNSMIHATAVAAGVRIATPSAAALLLKAAHSKNVVHIRPGESSMVKPAISGITKSSATEHMRFHHNVDYFRTGLAPGSTLQTCTGPSPSIVQDAAKSKRPEPTASSLPLNTVSTTVSALEMGPTPVSCASVCDFDEDKTTSDHNYGDWGLI